MKNMGANTVTTDDRGFTELINSDVPTLVDFWAEWCGPCKMMERPLNELAGEKTGKLTIAKLNVDDNPQTAMSYEVMSIPTMILFQGGEEKKRFVGARSKGQLEAELADYVG
jgi:thioredoxin 1